MNKQISIIGCGWFGLPLGKQLKKEGFLIKGSTTSKEKLPLLSLGGIEPFLINLSQDGISGPISDFLKDSEILIVNIPPDFRKHPNKDFVKQMKHLTDAVDLSSVKKVLLISSTSVFEDEAGFPEIYCDTAPNAKSYSSQQLITVEALFSNNNHFKTTVLRFAGLIGEDRHPCYHLSGKADLPNPDAPVNLIHLNDCVSISTQIVNKAMFGFNFNASFNRHPTKFKYYTTQCNKFNLAPPKFNFQKVSKGKIINSSFLVHKLNYHFKEPI